MALLMFEGGLACGCQRSPKGFGSPYFPGNYMRIVMPSLTAQMLIAQIQSAFAPVERRDGITLHQAIALDQRCSESEVAAARSQDRETHWTAVPRETLENFAAALSFMDPQGSIYYLPVFMIAALEGHISPCIPFFKLTNLLGSLRSSTPEQVILAYGFDRDQTLAIAAFLRFVVGEQGEQAESQAVLQLVWAWEACANNWQGGEWINHG